MASIYNRTCPRVFIPSSLLCLVLMSGNPYAQDIYKIVDEDGNVSYSAELPQSGHATKVMQVLATPSEASVEATSQRHEKIVEYLGNLDLVRVEQSERKAQNPVNLGEPNPVIFAEPSTRPRNLARPPAPSAR